MAIDVSKLVPVGGGTISLSGQELFDNLAREASAETGIPASYLAAIGGRESAFNPYAKAPTSSATGYMQIIEGTAEELGINPENPRENVLGGARYLKQQLDRYGNLDLALAAYFKGPGVADKLASGEMSWDDTDMTGGATVGDYVSDVKNKIAAASTQLPSASKLVPISETPQAAPQPVAEPVAQQPLLPPSAVQPVTQTAEPSSLVVGQKPIEGIRVPQIPIPPEEAKADEIVDMDKLPTANVVYPERDIELEEATKAAYSKLTPGAEKALVSGVGGFLSSLTFDLAKKAGLGQSMASEVAKSEYPLANLAGQIGGAVIPTVLSGVALNNLVMKSPAIIKGLQLYGKPAQVGLQMALRGAVALPTSIMRNRKGLLSGDPELYQKSVANIASAFLGSQISPLPEALKPTMMRPVIEAAVDALVETGVMAMFGENAWSKENLPATIAQALMSGTMAIRGVKQDLGIEKVRAQAKQAAVEGIKSQGMLDEGYVRRMGGLPTAKDIGAEEAVVPQVKAGDEAQFKTETKTAEGKPSPIPVEVAQRPTFEETLVRPTAKPEDMSLDALLKEAREKGLYIPDNVYTNMSSRKNVERALSIARKQKPTAAPEAPMVEPVGKIRKVGEAAAEPLVPEVKNVTSPEEIDAELELPTRKTGILSQAGAIGRPKPQVVVNELSTQGDPKVAAFETKMAKNDEDVHNAFVPPIRNRVRKMVDKAGTLTVDAKYAVKRMLGKDPDAENVLLKTIALSGASGEAKMDVSNLEKRVAKNLPHEYEKALDKYRLARRIIEIEDYYRTADPDRTFKHPQGITYDEAKSVVNAVESSPSAKILQTAADRIDTGYSGLLKMMRDEGLLTDESYNYLSTNYKHYDPRRFIEYLDPQAPSAKGGRKVSVGESGIKALDEGSEKAMLTNWRYAYADAANRAYSRVYKNRAAKALYDYAGEKPENPAGAKVNERVARIVDIQTAESIADNLLGAKTRLQNRLQQPLSIEKRLALEKKIDALDDAIGDLVVKKDMADVDADESISNLQKRILDIQSEQRISSESKREDLVYQKRIDAINKKIDNLAKLPQSQKIQNEINKLNKEKSDAENKIVSPLSPEQQRGLEKKLASVTEKMDLWATRIADAQKSGEGQIRLEGKALEDAPAGYERINVMVGGEKQAVLLPQEIADSWNKSGEIHNTLVANVLRLVSGSGLTRTFATGAGAPEFAIPNTLMDSFYTLMRFSKGYSPLLPKAVFQRTADIKAVTKDAINCTGLWEDYVKNGGSMEFLYQQGRFWAHDPSKAVTESMETGEQIYNAVTFLQGASERAGRLATYKRLIDSGIDKSKAAIMVRDGLDFSQGGTLVKFLDNIVPYLNPGTQATRGMFKAAKENPKVFAYKSAQLIAAGMLTAYLSKMLSPKGSQKISDRDKINNITIPLPTSFNDASGEERYPYLIARKDQGQRVFSTIGEVLVERAMGDINGEQAWKRIKMAVDDFLPAAAEDFIPPTIKFLVQYNQNKDFWMNEEIWKGRENISPHLEQYPGYTPDALIDFTDVASKVGVEISPARVHAAGRSLVPPNIPFAVGGILYDEVMGDGNDKKEVSKSIYEHMAKTPFVRKILRVTRPQKYQEEKVVERAERIEKTTGKKIETKDKPLGKLESEVAKAEREVADTRQINDNELRRLMKKGESPTTFLQQVLRQQGEDEYKRLLRKLPKDHPARVAATKKKSTGIPSIKPKPIRIRP